MQMLINCGTWITGYRAKIVSYISECKIFPNVDMISRATGVPKEFIPGTLALLRQQEGHAVGRLIFIEDDRFEGYSHAELAIYLFMRRFRLVNGRLPETQEFLNSHRYYDEEGNIHFRFTGEQVKRALKLFEKRDG